MLPPALCRTWLFVGGTDRPRLAGIAGSGTDAAILEFE